MPGDILTSQIDLDSNEVDFDIVINFSGPTPPDILKLSLIIGGITIDSFVWDATTSPPVLSPPSPSHHTDPSQWNGSLQTSVNYPTDGSPPSGVSPAKPNPIRLKSPNGITSLTDMVEVILEP
jgi:hypothetical protein